MRLDILGILVAALPSFVLAAAARAAPSFDPTVLTEGEPAIVGSCCRLFVRRDASDDFTNTACVFCGVEVALDVPAKALAFDGGVEGTETLWLPDDTEARRLATRSAVEDGMPGICIGGRSGSITLGFRESPEDKVCAFGSGLLLDHEWLKCIFTFPRRRPIKTEILLSLLSLSSFFSSFFRSFSLAFSLSLSLSLRSLSSFCFFSESLLSPFCRLRFELEPFNSDGKPMSTDLRWEELPGEEVISAVGGVALVKDGAVG